MILSAKDHFLETEYRGHTIRSVGQRSVILLFVNIDGARANSASTSPR